MNTSDRRKLRILVVSSIDGDAIKRLAAQHDVALELDPGPQELAQLMPGRDVIIFRSGVQFTADVLEEADRLELMIRAGAGLDNVDMDYLARKGIELRHVPEPGSRAVAELTLGLMISLARHIVLGDRLLRNRQWAKRSLMGSLLQGKNLGIIGAGRIGSQVGAVASALGMKVLGCVEPGLMGDPKVRAGLAECGIELCDFDTVVESADFLTIHVPLTNETRHLIDGKVIARMKPGSFLVNTSRGGVVDEEDLLDALAEPAHLGGAALDVYEVEVEGADADGTTSRLRELPNVILTPHIGSMAREVQAQIGKRILALVDEIAAG